MSPLFRKLVLAALPCCLAAAPAIVAQEAPQAPAPAAMTIERLDPALDAVLAPGTAIERVATGFLFTEGPMWHDGRLWFSDVRGDKLWAMTPEGQTELVMANAGGLANPPSGAVIGSNALVPAADGTILVTQMGARQIVKMAPDRSIRPFLSRYEGKRLNSPNDLVYDRRGMLWFTDPPFGLSNGRDQDPAKELPDNPVFRYANGQLTPVITDMPLPNGIGFSPDSGTLYVSNYGPEMYIRAYSVDAEGRLSDERELIRFPPGPERGAPDGLKVDSAGNIWTTGPGGIRIITPQGRILGRIMLPEVAANLAFAADGHTVYITASSSIYRLHSKVRGELPPYYVP